MNEEVTPRTREEVDAYIKGQTPLNNVYESSDFAQGIERGKLAERHRILLLLEASDSTCADWAINIIKKTK